MTSKRRRLIFILYALLAALSAAAMLAYLLSIPADPKNQVLFGLSLSRLAMAAFLAVGAAAFTAAAALALARSPLVERLLAALSGQDTWAGRLTLAAGWLGVILWLVVWIPPYRFGRGVYTVERLQPVLIWLTALALLTFLLLALLRQGWNRAEAGRQQPALAAVWRGTWPVYGVLLALLAFIAATRIGLTPDVNYWGGVGAPVLAWQLPVSLLAAGLAAVLARRAAPRRQWWVDLLVFLAIWGISAALWGSQVVGRHYFAPDPLPPNFEFYPYSDAQYYDRAAQSILIGEGYAFGTDVTRPLYIWLVAVLRGLNGQDLPSVVRVQSMLLACFPAVLYLLGKALHSRPFGVGLAVLAMLREWNALLATPSLEVAHSQMLMSDFPAALGTAVVVYLAVRWLQSREAPGIYSLLFGGSLAMASLLRFNAVLLLPVVLTFWWAMAAPNWRLALAHTGWALLGTLLIFVPWVARNYVVLGEISLEGNKVQDVFEQRIKNDPLPVNTPTPRVQLRPVQPALPGQAVVNLARFAPQHFLHSNVTSVLIFPTTLVSGEINRLIPASGYFHESWDGQLTPLQLVFVAANLFVLAAGISYSWRTRGWLGLLPLVAAQAYLLSNAVARVSGWRYNLPADWVFLLYYLLGLFAIAAWAAAAFRPERWLLSPHDPDARAPTAGVSNSWRRTAAAAGLLLAGGLLVAPEWIVPQRYEHRSSRKVTTALWQTDTIKANPDLEISLRRFLSREGSLVIEGRALYPEFYAPGMGREGKAPIWASKDHDDFRLGLIVIERWITGVVLPLEHEPDYLPSGADVIVIGCKQGDLMDAYALLVLDERGQFYVRPEEDPVDCSPSG